MRDQARTRALVGLSVFGLAAAFSIASPGLLPNADAATPNFQNNADLNITAALVSQELQSKFEDDSTFVGAAITAEGVQLSLTANPTSVQSALIKTVDANEAKLLSALPLIPASLVHVPISTRVVKNSLSTLLKLTADITGDRQKWADKGIEFSIWGPDLSENKVVIHVAHYTAAAAEDVESTYGSLVSVAAESKTVEGSSRTSDSVPWYAADKVSRPAEEAGRIYICTSWFSAVNSLGHDISAISGHCGAGNYTQNGQRFGTPSNIKFGGSMDAAAIPVAGSNSPYVWSDPTSINRHVTGTATADTEGQLLCTDGVSDREVCRVKVLAVNQSAHYNGQDITGLVYCYQIDNRAAFTPGDSGGPVEATMGSSETQAVGMIEAHIGNDKDHTTDLTEGFYMPARSVNRAFSLTIKT